jgi:hypothetical protein
MASSLAQAMMDAKSKQAGTFDVMIDIETFGPPPIGALATVGLVRFNRHTGELGPNVHLACTLRTSVAVGMKIEPDTAIWWATQSADAGRALVWSQNAIGVQLMKLATYFTPHDTVWAKPVHFDLVILRRAYELCQLKCPWELEQERCMSKVVKGAKAPTTTHSTTRAPRRRSWSTSSRTSERPTP